MAKFYNRQKREEMERRAEERKMKKREEMIKKYSEEMKHVHCMYCFKEIGYDNGTPFENKRVHKEIFVFDVKSKLGPEHYIPLCKDCFDEENKKQKREEEDL